MISLSIFLSIKNSVSEIKNPEVYLAGKILNLFSSIFFLGGGGTSTITFEHNFSLTRIDILVQI